MLILAFYGLTLEIILNKFDRTFSQSWFFFFAAIVLLVTDVTWSAWTASTPMADIIIYAETSQQLIASVFAFLFVVSLLLFWLLFAGIKQIAIEAGGSGWGWALLRFTPLIPLFWIAISILVEGNALVGSDGFLNLIRM